MSPNAHEKRQGTLHVPCLPDPVVSNGYRMALHPASDDKFGRLHFPPDGTTMESRPAAPILERIEEIERTRSDFSTYVLSSVKR